MLRSTFLALSTNEPVRQLMTHNDLGWRVASRFVAGETIREAIAAAEELNRRGATVELDNLGEHVADRGKASQALDNYLDMLDQIAISGIEAHVSIKPSQMGQEVDDELCFNNILSVLERAGKYGNFVWIDMEGSDSTERTIRLYTRLRSSHEHVGLALQAYLYRCKSDLETIVSMGGTVRLVKGAYDEPAHIAFPHKSDVDRNFKLLTEMLLSCGRWHAIATHDEKMIEHATEFARANGISNQNFEFQMLYGIRRDLQARLLRDGYRVRIYVPYGEQWYPYFMRRLAERPANVLFLIKNLITEIRTGE
ncbi:MAG: proline dehydrogenase family protein [Chloroflexi bacterium]|nr:proline dehydrogenase family protein [Chloroflexota bacterium]